MKKLVFALLFLAGMSMIASSCERDKCPQHGARPVSQPVKNA